MFMTSLDSPSDSQLSTSVGSLPHTFPNFQHPSHELLRENGFVWQVYNKYHAKCLKGWFFFICHPIIRSTCSEVHAESVIYKIVLLIFSYFTYFQVFRAILLADYRLCCIFFTSISLQGLLIFGLELIKLQVLVFSNLQTVFILKACGYCCLNTRPRTYQNILTYKCG